MTVRERAILNSQKHIHGSILRFVPVVFNYFSRIEFSFYVKEDSIQKILRRNDLGPENEKVRLYFKTSFVMIGIKKLGF